MGSGNPPAQQEIYRYSYGCAHTYSQSCEASLHTPCTVASMSGLGWPLTTEGCKGLAVTPTFPPRMLEMHAAAIEATSGTARGKGLGLLSQWGRHSSHVQDQHRALSTLCAGRNCSFLVSKTVRYSKKMKPGNA